MRRRTVSIVSVLLLLAVVSADEQKWWRNARIYEIFVPSFKDTNGDGIGDLRGILSKVGHFENIGIDAVWLSPIYQSPLQNAGYDISNYTSVEPKFGTMEDFEELVREFRKRGLKIIMDFVINHSSDEHTWFQHSINNTKPYDEYYIWRNPSGYDSQANPLPPNNWMAKYPESTSAWTWNDERKQFYYHQFSKNQPDLNLRNKNVVKEIKAITRFWLDKRINGIRLDSASYFIEHESFKDEPAKGASILKTELENDDLLEHIYTRNQPETHELIVELKTLLNEVNKNKEEFERILVAEVVGNLSVTTAYFGNKSNPESDISYNFDFTIPSTDYLSAEALDTRIKTWLNSLPSEATPVWLYDNRESEIAYVPKSHENYVDVMNIVVALLPGISITSYGQEIGMVNTPIRPHQKVNITSAPRKPMQWMDSTNSGFSAKSHPWLPMDPSYWRVNVRTEQTEKESHLKVYKALSEIRKTRTIKYGDFKSYIIAPWVYAFTRSLPGQETYIVILNMGTETEIINLRNGIRRLPFSMKVVASSINSGYKKGNIIMKKPRFPKLLVMRPLAAIVLSGKGKIGVQEDTSMIKSS